MNEFHKLITRKFQSRKICSSYQDRIRSADLIDVQLIIRYKRESDFSVLLIFKQVGLGCSVDRKKGITITSAFQIILDGFSHKRSNI